MGAEDAAKVQVLTSTFDDNGFGLFSTSSMVAVLSASTIVESNVGVWSSGASADIMVAASTVSANTTGVRNEATAFFAGSIVAGNDTDCAESPVVDGNYNIGGDGTCGFGINDSVDNTDPLLQPGLSDNGGPTETVSPSSTSPAVDVIPNNAAGTHAGIHIAMCNDVATSVDQRGERRRVGGKCDVGSVELAESSPALSSSPGPGASERTFTLTVTGETGLPDPQGSVTFTVAGSPVTTCTDVPIAGGQASCTLSGLDDDAGVSAIFVATNGYRGFDPPETTIESGPSGAVDTGSASFTYSSSESGSSFECRLDSGDFEPCSGAGKGYSGLAAGEHTFHVRAVDEDETADPTPANRTWTIDAGPPPDTEAPETTIESGPSGTVDTRSASFTYSSSESGSTFECRLDDGDFEPCPADGSSHTGLADGEHTFHVRATDAGDNTDLTPASRTWTIDSTPPGRDDDDDNGDDDGSDDGNDSDDDGNEGPDKSDGSPGLLPDSGGPSLILPLLGLLLLPLGAAATRVGRRRVGGPRHLGGDDIEP